MRISKATHAPCDVKHWTRGWVIAATVANALACGVDSPPVSLETVGTWTTVPAYEIGSMHGERSGFGRISDIRLGDQGKRVYVADPLEFQVTAWTPDGSPLFSVGGEGEGPGEFRSRTGAIHVTPDGFQVLDRDHIVVFSRDGHHLATVPVPSSVSYHGFRFRPLSMLEDGSLLAYPGVGSAYKIGWWGDDPLDKLPVARLRERDGHWTVDTLAVLDVRNEILGTGDTNDLALTMFMLQPYRDSDQVIYKPQSNTVVVVRMGSPGEVDLTELSVEGDAVWSRRIGLVPVALSARDVDELVDGLAEGMADARGSSSLLGAARSAVREALYVPEHYPPVQDVALASNGELWMRTFEDAGTDSLDVWYAVRLGESEKDAPVRRIVLPSSFSPHDATDAHVWGSRRDALGVSYVVGRRMIRQEGESE